MMLKCVIYFQGIILRYHCSEIGCGMTGKKTPIPTRMSIGGAVQEVFKNYLQLNNVAKSHVANYVAE
jgi:hypothetical protein